MKSSVFDFVASGLSIGAILSVVVVVVVWIVRPGTSTDLGEYHVIADFFVALFLYGIVSALLLRALLVVRRIVPGDYAMDSPTFAYWKLLTVIYRLGQKALLPFTPEFTRPWVARLFGARIG